MGGGRKVSRAAREEYGDEVELVLTGTGEGLKKLEIPGVVGITLYGQASYCAHGEVY